MSNERFVALINFRNPFEKILSALRFINRFISFRLIMIRVGRKVIKASRVATAIIKLARTKVISTYKTATREFSFFSGQRKTLQANFLHKRDDRFIHAEKSPHKERRLNIPEKP